MVTARVLKERDNGNAVKWRDKEGVLEIQSDGTFWTNEKKAQICAARTAMMRGSRKEVDTTGFERMNTTGFEKKNDG